MREGALVIVLANFGVAPEMTVALGVTVLVVSSASALVGAFVAPGLLRTRPNGTATHAEERTSAA